MSDQPIRQHSSPEKENSQPLLVGLDGKPIQYASEYAAANQEIGKTKQGLTLNQRLTLLVAIAGLITSVVSAVIYSGQLSEMRSGSEATNKLMQATRDNADAAKNAADAARSQASTAQQSLEASIRQYELDQRAWIGFEASQVDQYDKDKMLRAQIQFGNSGKTPAINIRRRQGIFISPVFLSRPPEQDVARLKIRPSGTLAPQGKTTIHTIESPFKTDYNEIAAAASVAYDSVKEKRMFVYIFGEILYDDIYRRHHVTRYCSFLVNAGEAQSPQWRLAQCSKFNSMN